MKYNKAMKSVHKELCTKVMTAGYDGLVANYTFETTTVPKDTVEAGLLYEDEQQGGSSTDQVPA